MAAGYTFEGVTIQELGKVFVQNPTSLPSTLRFGVFELDPRAGELRKKGMKIRLQGHEQSTLRATVFIQESPASGWELPGLSGRFPTAFLQIQSGIRCAEKKLLN
jgi:hypothetical protein